MTTRWFTPRVTPTSWASTLLLGGRLPFVEAVRAHNAFRAWPGGVDRSVLTHRETDRVARKWSRRSPLSVSADKLGSVAMR